jgi:hypothetical protein
MVSFTEMRNRDFISRCVKTAEREQARGCTPSVRRIVALTVFGGAGGYFMSFDRAMHLVYNYHNIPVDMRRPKRDERPSQVRARHLTEAAERLSVERSVSLTEAVTMVLKSAHAPRFYFSVEYGMRLFNQYTKRQTVYKPLRAVV